MTISTRDQLIDALANNSSRIVIEKGTVTAAAAGLFASYWRASGYPGVGTLPTTAAVCNTSTVGALSFTQQTGTNKSYLSILESSTSSAPYTVELHDRLMHMGGLSGIVTTAQTVGIDLASNLANSNIEERVGASDYSDIQWWIESYVAAGATASNLTANVIYDDGSTGALNITAVASLPAGRLISLNALMQVSAAGRYIRGVSSIQLSASTGTAGNFGITATRYRAANFSPIANARFTSDWAQTGLPEIPNDSCLFPVALAGVASASTIRATGKIIHG